MLLAVAVHVLLAVILTFGVRWQSRAPEVVSVELWQPPPPPAPEVQPEPPKPAPVPEAKPEPRIEKPDIAIKVPPKPKPKPEAKPKPVAKLVRPSPTTGGRSSSCARSWRGSSSSSPPSANAW